MIAMGQMEAFPFTLPTIDIWHSFVKYLFLKKKEVN
jgi:hypothetical protein